MLNSTVGSLLYTLAYNTDSILYLDECNMLVVDCSACAVPCIHMTGLQYPTMKLQGDCTPRGWNP